MEKKHPVVLTEYSQSHVLQQRMKEARLVHGDRVRADLNPVRIEANFGMYFCPMNGINIHEKIEAGDGLSLPQEAIVNGLEIPGNLKPGLYSLKNVELFSNGTLQVNATKETEFVYIDEHRHRMQEMVEMRGGMGNSEREMMQYERCNYLGGF